jgi:hypothetical protein
LGVDLDIDFSFDWALSLENDLNFAIDRELDISGTIYSLFLSFKFIQFALSSDIVNYELRKVIQAHMKKLPPTNCDVNTFDTWWAIDGKQWMYELRKICIDHRNIGHDWQFTKEQMELLNQYYEANLLLVECMNRSYVSKQVREEIESTMLMPRKK